MSKEVRKDEEIVEDEIQKILRACEVHIESKKNNSQSNNASIIEVKKDLAEFNDAITNSLYDIIDVHARQMKKELEENEQMEIDGNLTIKNNNDKKNYNISSLEEEKSKVETTEINIDEQNSDNEIKKILNSDNTTIKECFMDYISSLNVDEIANDINTTPETKIAILIAKVKNVEKQNIRSNLLISSFEKKIEIVNQNQEEINKHIQKLKNRDDYVDIGDVDIKEIEKQVIKQISTNQNLKIKENIMPKNETFIQKFINSTKDNLIISLVFIFAIMLIVASYILGGTKNTKNNNEISILTKKDYVVYCDDGDFEESYSTATKLTGTLDKEESIFHFSTKIDGKEKRCFISENEVGRILK